MASKKKSAGLLFDEVLPQAQRTARSLLSLDPQEDVPASQQALEMALGFVPGVGQAMALRDIERARRANDPAAAAMAATSFVPFGRLAGLGKKAGPVMSELDVYHGSPHRFEEFDASKIGTGEGAQAFGHGIYFAENPDVARGYKTANELTQTVVEGKVIDFSDPRYQAAVRISRDGYQNALKKAIEESKSDFLTPEGKQKRMLLAEQVKALKGKKIGAETTGAFYTADLPDEMVDRMLDYDKPLKDQPAAYKAIRSTIPDDVVKDFDANVERGITGGNAYQNWVWGGKTPSGRSEKLRELGIPGIKYADAGSRGQGGSGTRNFVVFPGEEKKVKIKKRE